MIDATTNEPSRFFLQAIDIDLGCPVLEAAFRSTLPTWMNFACCWDHARTMTRSCDTPTPSTRANWQQSASGSTWRSIPGDHDIRVERWHSLRAIPYLVHTGYELPLLLNGTKKFARFLEVYPPYGHYKNQRSGIRGVSASLAKMRWLPASKPANLT
jgi:hypothetical protein